MRVLVFSVRQRKPHPDQDCSAHVDLGPPHASCLRRAAQRLRQSYTAARALQKVSSSTDPVDMLTSTRAMSAFHLETVLSAKMISKTSQAIEKLTNLS